jgi:hypothetical protein
MGHPLGAAASLLLLGLAGAPALAQTAAPPAPEPLVRRISVGDLGFAGGIALEGLGAARDIFLPVPRDVPLLGARLVLQVESRSIFAGRRGVEVLANGRPILSRALPDGGERIELSLPIEADDLARGNGFLRLTIRSIGALTENRCLDQRLAGERLTVLEGSHLELRLPGDVRPGAAALVQLMPREVTVVTRPGPLPPAEAMAALTAGHALAARGHNVSFASDEPAARGPDGGWTRGVVLVGEAVPQGAAGRLEAVTAGGLPALALGGARPDIAARALAAPWQAVADGQRQEVAAALARLPGQGEPGLALPLIGLRGDLGAQDIVERGGWTIEFGARDLPPGTRPSALVLDIAAAPDAAGERPVAAVFFNETLIASQSLGAQMLARLVVPVPDGLAALDNRVRVVVQRRPRGGECETQPAGAPVQILPSSALRLAAAPMPPADFFELAPRWRDGVAILSDAPVTAARLALMLAVLRGHAPPGAPLMLGDAGATPAAPFLAFTVEPPPGLRTPPLRFDRGRVVVADRQGRTVLDLAAPGGVTTAQLVATSGGVPGIWVRTAEGAVPRVLPLDRGDVAFADANGVTLAFATGREQLLRVTYPDDPGLLALVERYRPWIVGGLWLALTALLVGAVVRRWRRRNQARRGEAG